MDLRLPMGSAATTPESGWPAPATEVAPPAASPSEEPHHDEEDEDRPRRRRGQRRATESFAEALARAEDPTKPELPGAAETAAAMAALREEAANESEHAPEAVLPRELPAAEPIPLPEEPEGAGGEAAAPVAEALDEEAQPATAVEAEAAITPTEGEVEAGAVVDEAVAAEPSADADVEAQAAVSEPEPEAEAGAAIRPAEEMEEEASAGVEPMPAASDEAAPVAEPADIAGETQEGAADVAPEHVEAAGDTVPEAMQATVEDVAAAPPEEAATTAADEAPPIEAPPEETPAAEPAAVAASAEAEPEPEPIAWDPERYTVEIIEPDWYAEEEPEPIAAASAATSAPETEAEPEPSEAAPELVEAGPRPEPAEPERMSSPEPAPAPDAPSASEPPSAPEPSSASAEETMLWFGQAPDAATDEGADEIEVVGAAHRSGPAPMPGSQELDDALAALDALSQGGTAASDRTSDEGWPPAVGTDDRPIDAVATPPPTMSSEPTADDAPSTSPPGLLPSVRPPATSASRAYRRLRRIFPG